MTDSSIAGHAHPPPPKTRAARSPSSPRKHSAEPKGMSSAAGGGGGSSSGDGGHTDLLAAPPLVQPPGMPSSGQGSSGGGGMGNDRGLRHSKRPRRTVTEAQAEQEAEEDGFADWARPDVLKALGRGALVNGNDRSCCQDALVAIAVRLGLHASNRAVRAATLPAKGDTAVGAIKLYAQQELGIEMVSLKDHSVLGYSIFEAPGGPEHNLLLLLHGQYWVELVLTMPASKGVPAKTDRHVVAFDADFRDGDVYGLIIDNAGPAKRLNASDRAWPGKPTPPPARRVFESLFPGAAKVAVANAWLCRRVGVEQA